MSQMDLATQIVDTIELERERYGMSVAELARRSTIERKRLWYVLNHQRQMRSDELIKLCAVLNMGLGRFLSREQAHEFQQRESH